MMQAATIVIQYVNPPTSENGPGSIKDTNGVLYQVWGEQLNAFIGKEGQTVTINYKTGTYRGKPQYTVLGLAGGQGPQTPALRQRRAVSSQGMMQTGTNMASPMPPAYTNPAKKDENIAVLALAKLYEGKLGLGDRQALVATLKMCRSAWRELQDGGMPSALQQELNDEIPSFEEKIHTLDETYE